MILKNVLISVLVTETARTDAPVPIIQFGVQMSLVKEKMKFLSITASTRLRKLLYSAPLVAVHLILFVTKTVQKIIPETWQNVLVGNSVQTAVRAHTERGRHFKLDIRKALLSFFKYPDSLFSFPRFRSLLIGSVMMKKNNQTMIIFICWYLIRVIWTNRH